MNGYICPGQALMSSPCSIFLDWFSLNYIVENESKRVKYVHCVLP